MNQVMVHVSRSPAGWMARPIAVGAGETPLDAVEDLLRRLGLDPAEANCRIEIAAKAA